MRADRGDDALTADWEKYDQLREADEKRGSVQRSSYLARKQGERIKTRDPKTPTIDTSTTPKEKPDDR